jgi:hypothetical protein
MVSSWPTNLPSDYISYLALCPAFTFHPRASQFSNLCGKIKTENHWEEGTMGGIKSLKAYIERIPDFRRRQGRIYPLTGLLMMLILAAVNGESSLRPKELGKNMLA